MNFLYPQFLFALLTVLIPVIVHLFNFQRYRKVVFSNTALLKEVKHSIKSKSTLKHILILISRIFAIVSIVLAFAQPYIPYSNEDTAKIGQKSSIFLDNSFSMESQSTDGRIMDLAREYAYQISDGLPNNINHQLLTNEFSGSQQHLYPATELSKQISEVNIIGKSQSFSRILKRQSSAMDGDPYTSYIISDFQESQFDFSQLPSNSQNRIILVPIEPVITDNISIDSVWFNNPVHRINQPEKVHFRVRNYSLSNKTNIRVTLYLNEQQKSFTNLSIPAQSYIDTFMVYSIPTTGWFSGKIEVSDSPILFDNQMYFSFHISDHINVLSVNSGTHTDFIRKAFDLEPYFQFTEMDVQHIDYGIMFKTDFLILNEVESYSSGLITNIRKYILDGGNVLIFPPKDIETSNINSLLSRLDIQIIGRNVTDTTRVSYLDFDSEIYKGVFENTNYKNINLPTIYRRYSLGGNSSQNKTSLLSTLNKQDILSMWNISGGSVFLFSIPLQSEFSNLGKHSIFLPTLYQIAFQSKKQPALYYTLGNDNYVKLTIQTTETDRLFHVVNPHLNVDFIPELIPENNQTKLGMHGGLTRSGNYEVLLDNQTVSKISFNYTRDESNPKAFTSNELQTMIDSIGLSNFLILDTTLTNFSTELRRIDSGISLWEWFIVAALLFLGIETLLIRYFKPSVL